MTTFNHGTKECCDLQGKSRFFYKHKNKLPLKKELDRLRILSLDEGVGTVKSRRPSGRGSYIRARNSEQGISRDIPFSPPPLQSTLMNFLHKLCRKPHHFLYTNELCCGCDIFLSQTVQFSDTQILA
jgi:hypothetical protein